MDQHGLYQSVEVTIQSRTWFSGSKLRGLGSEPLAGLTAEQASCRRSDKLQARQVAKHMIEHYC